MDYLPDRLLPSPVVQELTTLSRPELHRRVRDGRFPAPVKLGERRIAWRASDIADFIANLSAGAA
jgi:prophage regulatory protein